LLLPLLLIGAKEPVGLLDRHGGAVDERGCNARDCTQMGDGSEVVVQEKPHREHVDFVVRFGGPLLQYPRELANSRRRHISQMADDWILRTVVRCGDIRRLREEAFDLCESIGRVRRDAQRVSGQKVPQKPL
jgi:hypothetical protein